jgi:hypothetical protein
VIRVTYFWAPRDTPLLIMSYHILPFRWCIVVIQLPSIATDSIRVHVWIGSNSGKGRLIFL